MADVNKRYYWLRLKNTYFRQLTQKKMKRQEHGLEMQIVYLKMMLLSVDKNGCIFYQGVYNTIEEELAEEFDEDLQIVQQTLEFLKANDMIIEDADNSTYFIPEAKECVGSECGSAERMRRSRAKKKEETSQCDTNVTQCDTDVTSCDVEKEIDIEKEKNNIINYQEIINMYNDTCVSFPKVTKLSEKRKKAINARLKVYSMEDFKQLFRMAEESNFLKGQNNRNWSANFDWLIADSNMAKVLDGNYSERKPAAVNRPPKEPQKEPSYYSILREIPPSPDDPFQ